MSDVNRQVISRMNKVAAAVALATAASACPIVAVAQEPLDEIVVTATRRDTTIQEVPYSISVLSSATLKRHDVQNLAEAIRLMPGVGHVDLGGRNTGNISSIIVRGINADNQSANADFITTRAPTVSTYIDETPLFFELDIHDIERVEFLRGPQGTLYGSGSLGGTIRFITKKPNLNNFAFDVTGNMSSTSGGDPNYGIGAVINAPISDAVGFRAAGKYQEWGGFIDLPYAFAEDPTNQGALPADPANPITSPPLLEPGKNFNDSSSLSFRPSVLIQPTEKFRANVAYYFNHFESSARQAVHPDPSAFFPGSAEQSLLSVDTEPFERDVNLGSLELEFDFGFATLTSSTSHYTIESSGVTDYTDNIIQKDAYYTGAPYPRQKNTGDVHSFEQEAFTQEIRLGSNNEGLISWVVGVHYNDFKHVLDYDFGWRGVTDYNTLPGNTMPVSDIFTGMPVMDDATFAQRENYSAEELAFFGELTLNITDQWQVTGGIRSFDIKSDLLVNVEYLVSSGFPPSQRTGDTDESDQVFKLNTSYDFSDNLKIYATWAEAYRRGGANALGPLDEPSFGLYLSDTADNFEVGVKGRIDDRVQYTVAAFRIDWDDVQFSSFSNFGTPIVANGESAESTGFELEAFGSLSDRLTFAASYTNVDAKATGSIFLPGVGDPEAGERLPGVPEHMASLRFTYDQSLRSGNSLSYGLSAFYRSDALAGFSTDLSFFEIDAFSIINASLSLQAENWTITAFVDNLGDEKGITGGTGPGLAGPLGNQRYVSRPRTAGLRFTYSWAGS